VAMLYITTNLAITGIVKMTSTRIPTVFIIWSKELHDVITVSLVQPLLIFILKEDYKTVSPQWIQLNTNYFAKFQSYVSSLCTVALGLLCNLS
jgi:hypothetical protein